jgi:single-strand DNA-binding protein
MQSVIIEGYLAADPSILTAQGSGKKRAGFRLLETARFRRGDGQPGERTTGFNCVCFNEQTADSYIAPYARKGSRLVLGGHVENDTLVAGKRRRPSVTECGSAPLPTGPMESRFS